MGALTNGRIGHLLLAEQPGGRNSGHVSPKAEERKLQGSRALSGLGQATNFFFPWRKPWAACGGIVGDGSDIVEYHRQAPTNISISSCSANVVSDTPREQI